MGNLTKVRTKHSRIRIIRRRVGLDGVLQDQKAFERSPGRDRRLRFRVKTNGTDMIGRGGRRPVRRCPPQPTSARSEPEQLWAAPRQRNASAVSACADNSSCGPPGRQSRLLAVANPIHARCREGFVGMGAGEPPDRGANVDRSPVHPLLYACRIWFLIGNQNGLR